MRHYIITQWKTRYKYIFFSLYKSLDFLQGYF